MSAGRNNILMPFCLCHLHSLTWLSWLQIWVVFSLKWCPILLHSCFITFCFILSSCLFSNSIFFFWLFWHWSFLVPDKYGLSSVKIESCLSLCYLLFSPSSLQFLISSSFVNLLCYFYFCLCCLQQFSDHNYMLLSGFWPLHFPDTACLTFKIT